MGEIALERAFTGVDASRSEAQRHQTHGSLCMHSFILLGLLPVGCCCFPSALHPVDESGAMRASRMPMNVRILIVLLLVLHPTWLRAAMQWFPRSICTAAAINSCVIESLTGGKGTSCLRDGLHVL